jgi:hypothetical protein
MSRPHQLERIDLVAIKRFRDALPPWRWHWFDSLSLVDQSRLAEGREYAQDADDDRDQTTQ